MGLAAAARQTCMQHKEHRSTPLKNVSLASDNKSRCHWTTQTYAGAPCLGEEGRTGKARVGPAATAALSEGAQQGAVRLALADSADKRLLPVITTPT
jgi:hypothetical protein